MKGTKLVRLLALLLSVTMFIGGTAVAASAASTNTATDSDSSTTDTSLADIRELLNAISYNEYVETWFGDVKPATEAITIDVTAGVYQGSDEFEVTTRNDGETEVTVLYTPADGSVTWTIDVPETARYALKIEYYPDQNRATSIERTLSINGKVPFSEARYLTLPKNWVNSYDENFDAPDGYTMEEFRDMAKEIGFEADIRDVKLATGETKTQVVIPYPTYWTSEMVTFAEEHNIRFFQTDYLNNELRPSTVDEPKFMTFYLKDSSGFYQENFEMVFEQGQNTITLEGRNEPMSIKSITLEPYQALDGYDAYIAELEDKGVDTTKPGSDTVRLEAEIPSAMSNKTIYPIEDRSCAINSPTDPTRTVLNTVGGEKWNTVGQWVEYTFQVNSSGMYDVVSRFRQNVLDGMFTCRSLYIYSDGVESGAPGYYDGAPFAEALRLTYDFDDEWQVGTLSDGRTDTNGDGKVTSKDERTSYAVYLEANVTYTIRVEAALGRMGDIVREVQESVNVINNAYLQIIQLTGTSPDALRDYGFNEIMPDVMVDMVIEGEKLEALSQELTELGGGKSSNVGTLETVSRLLLKMGRDEDEIAGNLSSLKDYIGTLGTFLSDAQTQPLQLDYIQIQPLGSELPAASPNFFTSLWHEIVGFFQSFTRDYNNMGALEENEEGSLTVWMASARDQFQIMRNLINYSYSGKNNIAVDLKLIAGGTLLPSILAGSGPDLYLGMGSGEIINYAIRSAIMNIEDIGTIGDEATTWERYAEIYEGNGLELLTFKEYALEYAVDESYNTIYDENGDIIIDNPDAAFNHAAMYVLGITDADNQMHYYGLPESQSFGMMFVRIDVLADLGLEIPRTWDELLACIPTLQANNMEIGLPKDSNIFLYQKGGELFADDGMRINLDSALSLSSFDFMCNLFTMYSFPYAYDASNRFRTGEMPIIIGDYVATYNQLKVFATEIEGKWTFVPMPGEVDEYGNINNVVCSDVAAIVMVKGCEDRVRAWTFMEWYTGAECRVDFSNEMVAIMGPSAKQSTANRYALAQMPWTTDEYNEISAQFSNLASIPNYPGAYIVGRYTGFAFTNAYTANADPATQMLSYINVINKEINRKRLEFDLETLSETLPGGEEVEYKNLQTKRMAQAQWLAETIQSEYDKYDTLMDQVFSALRSEDDVEINVAMEAVKAAYEGIADYETIYNNDRIAVMGYDANDRTLSKEAREKARKCFIYELYKETDNEVTRLYCLADFLSDICRLANQK